ncbi:MAG: DNA/RNA non-specific endonuclease [Clostridia bacterium]|nr:DNA/RNA non-specific endonuclease [Clostridia bacterium]
MKSNITKLLGFICILALLVGCSSAVAPTTPGTLPQGDANAYKVLNNNQPLFTEAELTTDSYESYSNLDSKSRCGVAMACIGVDIMPTEERGNIGQVKPSGWQTVKYDIVDGKYLYNRCHLIGFQLTGENANTKNLITGTRYMNNEGMLPFENMIADYVKSSNNHVLYRVTPDFQGDELVARGVTLEAKSIEDNGVGICFNVYCYNKQPGIVIDYATGKSHLENQPATSSTATTPGGESVAYVLNRSNMKFHLATCRSVDNMKAENREDFTGNRQYVIDAGYEPCKNCNP